MTATIDQLPRGPIMNATRIRDTPNSIQKIDPDHFLVMGLRHHEQRLRVYKSGQRWRCASDRRSDQDKPCAHILAVLDHEGLVELPASYARRSAQAREVELEEEARLLVPKRLPELLADLLNANPAQEPPYSGFGRPPLRVYPQAYQAVLRAVFHSSIRGSQASADDRVHNPWGSVSRASMARFLASTTYSAYMERLLCATLDAASAYEGPETTTARLRATTSDGPIGMDLKVSARYGLLSEARLWAPEEPAPAPGESASLPGLGGAGWHLALLSPVARRTEALALMVAHNLGRLIVLELEAGIRVQFHRVPLGPVTTAPGSDHVAAPIGREGSHQSVSQPGAPVTSGT
jgi:hypothetical protein